LWRSAGATSAPQPVRHIAQPLRALLLDTNPVSARVMSLYLSSWGIDATVVATAGEAEAACTAAAGAERPFDVAILDFKGLGAAGLDLARKIRSDAHRRRAEIIALIGIDGLVADENLERLGAFATLTKPVRPSELFNCLASLAARMHQGEVVPFFMRRNARAARPQFDARILVAEDNAVNREVAVDMLEQMGCRVVTTPNGWHAAQLFAQEAFDLVLMDCEMPVMDGFEAARRIRETEKRSAKPQTGPEQPPRIPVIAVTAHALAEVHARCLEAGMDDFLVKPFDEQQLTEALRRWLGSRERAPDNRRQAEPASEAIDTAAIEAIRAIKGRSSVALLQRVVSQFTATAPALAADIRTKSVEGDAEAVWRAAHNLKSSAAAIGARQLSRSCATIETIARETGVGPVRELLDTLDAELASATRSLQELT
jgi:CheY-like chemotaxis protein/HPt (histidine-containing phosphotransfer) domain-containing protein